MKRIIVLGALQQYQDTLVWYAHRSWSERDLPGSCNLAAGGSRVFDAVASNELHLSMRSNTHRRAMHRAQLIGFALSRMHAESRKLLEASFEPFGAGRVSYTLYDAASWRGACLLPIMLSELSRKRHDSLPAKQSPLQILEALAHAQNLDGMVTEAQEILVALVAQYKVEVDAILCHLNLVADRTTASAYTKAFEHVEH